MYESPIRLIESQMRTDIENHVYRAVKEVGVYVDKEELIRALEYDRDQYAKGYMDGVKEFSERLKNKIRDEIWGWVGDVGYESNRAYATSRVWTIINEMVEGK